jgi:hypothetical protein
VATEPPYPRSTPDFVPYREFEQLARRVGFIEQKAIGEAIVRLEERQNVLVSRIGQVEVTLSKVDTNVEQLQKSEMARAGFRLGTKELVVMMGVVIGMIGTVVAVVVAVGLH